MEIKTPKVSVVMPTYNAQAHLSKAIDSILAQTFDDFEFLIIDDNSTDRTREIIKSYNDKRIRLIDGCCDGLSAALNYGIREAKGEYIARMDADDTSLPTRFEKQVVYMDEHRDITVLGSWQKHIDEDGNIVSIHAPFANNEELMISFAFEVPVCHSTVMLRRCDIVENKFFYLNDSPCEDLELWMRIIKTHKFATIKEVLGNYLESENSITKKKKEILPKYEETLKQNYIRDMFDYTFKDKDKYLLHINSSDFFWNASRGRICSAIVRLKEIFKEIELAINKKRILPKSRVHEILDFFRSRISEQYKIKKVNYKLFGIIPLVKTIHVGDRASVYLFNCILILSRG